MPTEITRSGARARSPSAIVFMHPDACKPPVQGRAIPLIEVAFEMTRASKDMLYAGTLRRYPNIIFTAAHPRGGRGGALPLLADRFEFLVGQPWVPNLNNITEKEIKEQLGRLLCRHCSGHATGVEVG
jgi:hypothetical protein